MPKHQSGDISTPADVRLRQRGAALIFCVFLAAVLAVLGTTVLAVNEGRNYKRLVRQLGLEDYLLPSTPAAIQVQRQPADPVFPSRLINTTLADTATFRKTPLLSAEERCSLLKNQAGDPSFTATDDGWECVFFQEFGTAVEQASLFIQSRGSSPDTIRSFRLKISHTDPIVELAVLREVFAAIDRYALPLTPQTRTYLREKLSRRAGFTATTEDYRITFSAEMMDARRFNLLILPLPDKIACDFALAEPAAPSARRTFAGPIACLDLAATLPLSRPTS